MLSVHTRHHPDCTKKDDSNYRRCRCPKWLDGTLPGGTGRIRVSAKTKSWEQAELLSRKYENSADTFAVEMRLAGVPIDQVSILLGHASVRVTEKHYSPWVRARQDQPENSMQSAWELLPEHKAVAS